MRNKPTPIASPRLPRTVAELIDELARRYPEPRPGPGRPLDEIMFAAGARSVVLMLQDWQAKTRQKDLQPDVSS